MAPFAPGQYDHVRCFAAVWPSPEVLEQLAALPRPPVAGLRWTTPQQWHVTLRFFGELDNAQIEGARQRLQAVAWGFPRSLAVRGGPASCFLGPGLVVWPVQGLDALGEAVARATGDLGEPLPRRPFYGHLTLARARPGHDARRRPELLAPLSAGWAVSRLCLVESVLHPQGARYRNVAEMTLGQPGAPEPRA